MSNSAASYLKAENNNQTHNIIEDVMHSIDASSTQYHVIKEAINTLEANVSRETISNWDIIPNQTHVVTRNDASAIFFAVPDVADKNITPDNIVFDIVAAHTDSPCLKVKHDPIIIENDGTIRLNVAEYGSSLKKTWFDRPLSIAGRVSIKTHGEHKSFLVDLRDYLTCVIPSVAPHMTVTESDEVSVQSQMLPIIGNTNDLIYANSEKDLPHILDFLIADYIADTYGREYYPNKIYAYDLNVYCVDDPRIIGTKESKMLLSPRIDDQGSVWSAVYGFKNAIDAMNAKTNDTTTSQSDEVHIPVLVLFDDEENGSTTYNAADSTFLDNTLMHIYQSLTDSADPIGYNAALLRSFMLSADNGHAQHPAWSGTADLTNKVRMNGGVVIKFSPIWKYMTDSRSAAAICELCDTNDIPYQFYHNNSDVRGGSTLGNISSRHVSIPGADIGLPQLAMHSVEETCGVADILSMTKLFEKFFAGERSISATCSDIMM